jgi:hypothetical protein
MENTLRDMAKEAIRLYREKRLKKELGPDGKAMWLTCGFGDICDSCEPLHGQVKTMSEWQAFGKPGSARLICKKRCRCQLVPAD